MRRGHPRGESAAPHRGAIDPAPIPAHDLETSARTAAHARAPGRGAARGPRRALRGRMRPRDLCALGAAHLPTKDLVAILLKRGHGPELDEATRALSLTGAARDAALRALAPGPQLLAAVELGRRAWMRPSPAGRRVRAPVDVAAVVAPRATDEDAAWIVALDLRLTVVRAAAVAADPGPILRTALAAGARFVAIARKRASPAVPLPIDVE